MNLKKYNPVEVRPQQNEIKPVNLSKIAMKRKKVNILTWFILIVALIVALTIVFFRKSSVHEGRKRVQSSVKCDSDNTDKSNIQMISCQVNKLDNIFHFEGVVSNGSNVPVSYVELKFRCDTDKGEKKEFTFGNIGENKIFDVIEAGEKAFIPGQLESTEIFSNCRAEVANWTNYYQTIQ
jgi:hypothetical protein